MPATPLVPPDMSGWPEHWQRPTLADLDLIESAYARGFVLPHDPVLRRPAEPLLVGSPQCKQVTEKLYEAARHEHADARRPVGGIAAPQIGQPVRAFLFDPRHHATAPPEPHQLACVVNPIVYLIDEGDRVWWPEGCLSTANIRAWVRRARHIRLLGYTPDGEPVDRTYGGRTAIIVQHEIDHLDGILCPDRVEDPAHRMWVTFARFKQFYTYAATALGSDTPPPWEPTCPPEQWEATQHGSVYGNDPDR